MVSGNSLNEDIVEETRRFMRAADVLQVKLAERYSLVTSDLLALGYLMDETTLSPTELGHRVNLQSGSVTPLIRRLREAGLIVRQPDPRDLRRVTLFLTEEGERIYRETAVILIAAVDQVLSDMSGRDGLAVLKFLRGMTEECLNH